MSNNAGMRAFITLVESVPMITEAYGLEKPDGSRITPTDLYQAVNQMAAGYGGSVGQNLMQASKSLYAAHQAYVAEMSPQAAAPVPATAPAPAAPPAA